MRARNLRRKNLNESPIEEIILAILLEHEGSGLNLGYRSMWQRLRKVYKLTVKQKTVMVLLREIDPEGVEDRCRYKLKRRAYNVPGPNFTWHADNHDKIKRFGFPIYGCIDGFSKKIMWIRVSETNNDPAVIAHYFLESVEKHGFLPTILRTDHGTEATIMADLQRAMRFDHDDENAGMNSYIQGRSTHNQRIEAYWRQFRQHMGDFYMHLFKSMEGESSLDIANPLHIQCLRYAFGNLIQEDLLLTMKEWNEHRVRKQNNRNIPGGSPDELYKWPENYGGNDFKKEVNIEQVKELYEYTKKPQLVAPDFKTVADVLVKGIPEPNCVEDAYDLYKYFLSTINRIL